MHLGKQKKAFVGPSKKHWWEKKGYRNAIAKAFCITCKLNYIKTNDSPTISFLNN